MKSTHLRRHFHLKDWVPTRAVTTLRRNFARRIAVSIMALASLSSGHAAQEPDRAGQPSERLGTVHFATSCAPAVAATFDRAVSLLHSFWFPAAIQAFSDVLKDDPNCGIAYWGIALSQWGNPFGGGRTAKTYESASFMVQKAWAIGSRTERERNYVAAVGELYKDFLAQDERTRVVKYAKAMQYLAEDNPDDTEAQIFYALALTATALPTDKTFANQLQAAEILEKQFAAQPDHPGVAHYLIHAYDVPALAPRALNAARSYAAIAPSAPHALHMPSHTFTRVGDWEASIATNIRSAETARNENQSGAALHASDYMVYAYLQSAQDRAARRVVDETARSTGDLNSFAMAAMAARYVIEREAWAEAKTLEVHPDPAAPHTDAITRFARALGFARSGDPESAQGEIAELEKLRDILGEKKDDYWKEQVEIQRLAASAWTAYAAGKKTDALALLRSAADREDATEKAAVTPGPLKPAREQLGEMLLESNEPAQALKEFEATLTKEPNRFRAVHGAARAAQQSGDRTKTRAYFQQLLDICKNADAERPELREARQAVG